MDRPHNRQKAPATAVRERRLRNPRIGFIGKGKVSAQEKGSLYHIGKCVAAIGHTTVIIPAPGATDALREGVKAQGGKLDEVQQGIIEAADHTWVYPDIPLLERLEAKYKDLGERPDVLIIQEHQLDEWVEAIHTLMDSLSIPVP